MKDGVAPESIKFLKCLLTNLVSALVKRFLCVLVSACCVSDIRVVVIGAHTLDDVGVGAGILFNISR